MSDTTLQKRAHEAAIDHGLWLAPDDDETNYQAFVTGYYRGWSDKVVYSPQEAREVVAALLDPATLTSEERAIVDTYANIYSSNGTAWAETLYEVAWENAEPVILARRALFAPASKPTRVECPNCGEMTGRSHSRYEGPGPDKWSCQPAQPKPAAPVEMPEAVREAVGFIRREARAWEGELEIAKEAEGIADDLASWWRTHAQYEEDEVAVFRRGYEQGKSDAAQPVAVGMSEELKAVLDFAADTCGMAPEEGWRESKLKEIRPLISVVRQQAAQPQRPKLEKVREALVYLKNTIAAANDGWAGAWGSLRSSTTREQIDAALAELDAAEGKGE